MVFCNSDEIMDEKKWAPLNEKDLLSTWVTGKRQYAVGVFKNVSEDFKISENIDMWHVSI